MHGSPLPLPEHVPGVSGGDTLLPMVGIIMFLICAAATAPALAFAYGYAKESRVRRAQGDRDAAFAFGALAAVIAVAAPWLAWTWLLSD